MTGDKNGAVYILFLDTNAAVKNTQQISDSQGGLAETLLPLTQFGSAVASIGDFNGE